jgi:DNA-binding transcriptional LysR family regulator
MGVRGSPASLDDLRGFPLIGFERETVSVQAVRGLGLGLELKREAFSFRADSDLGQLAAIRAGCGVGVCQTGLAARDPDLVRVLPDAFHADMEAWVVIHEDLKDIRRVRLVFDKLVEGLAAYAASA